MCIYVFMHTYAVYKNLFYSFWILLGETLQGFLNLCFKFMNEHQLSCPTVISHRTSLQLHKSQFSPLFLFNHHSCQIGQPKVWVLFVFIKFCVWLSKSTLVSLVQYLRISCSVVLIPETNPENLFSVFQDRKCNALNILVTNQPTFPVIRIPQV